MELIKTDIEATQLRVQTKRMDTVAEYLRFAALLESAARAGMPEDTHVYTNGSDLWAEHRVERVVGDDHPNGGRAGVQREPVERINGRCFAYVTDLVYRKVDHPPHDYEDHGQPWHCVGGKWDGSAVLAWPKEPTPVIGCVLFTHNARHPSHPYLSSNEEPLQCPGVEFPQA